MLASVSMISSPSSHKLQRGSTKKHSPLNTQTETSKAIAISSHRRFLVSLARSPTTRKAYARRRRPPPAMPTTSPVKRAGGRLRRLLASLRPPARKGPLPVQTGFPTSLADLVVKNHDRLRKPRRRHCAAAAPTPPVVASAAAAVEEPAPQQRRELSVAQDTAVRAPAPGRPIGAGFNIRPEVLAVGGVLALALLVIWGKWLVVAATFASVALFWIESVRSPAARRRPRSEAEEEADSRGRRLISPIREAESPVETPRPSCAASDTGSEASSLLWAADTTDLAGENSGSISPNKRKEKRRSLRKLLAKKLQNGRKRPKEDKDSRHGGESERPGAGVVPEPAVVAAPAEETAPPPEAVADERRHRRPGAALPLASFVPLVLVGLVAGKLPAVALTVLCAVFYTSVDRVPDTTAQVSGHGSDDPR